MHVSMGIFRLGPSSGGGAMEHCISIDAMGQILGVYEHPTNPVYFDTFGLTWKLGVRATF
jgi:hypothetical protein